MHWTQGTIKTYWQYRYTHFVRCFSKLCLRTWYWIYLYTGHTIRVMNQNNSMEKWTMINLVPWLLWNLIWSLWKWSTTIMMSIILEREFYYAMALWHFIMLKYTLSLMFMIWGNIQCIYTTSTRLIINKTLPVFYRSLKLYWTASRLSCHTQLHWYCIVTIQYRIKIPLCHFSLTCSEY